MHPETPSPKCHLHISASPFSPLWQSPSPISAKLKSQPHSFPHEHTHNAWESCSQKPQLPRASWHAVHALVPFCFMSMPALGALQSINVAVASRRMTGYVPGATTPRGKTASGRTTWSNLYQPSPIPKRVGVLDLGNLKTRGTGILRGSHRTTRQARHALILPSTARLLYTHTRKQELHRPTIYDWFRSCGWSLFYPS